MTSKTIDYYFAAHSPWTYLGHERFMALTAKYGLAVDFRPVTLKDIFAASGGVPLAQRPEARKRYRLVELARWHQHLGIEMNIQPAFFPVDERLANLVFSYAEPRFADMGKLLLAVFRAVWVGERNIADPAHLKEVLEAAGFDPAWVDAAATDEAAADQIAKDTQAAIAAGAVGAPCYVYEGEPFWGQDRLDLLAWRLAQAGH